MSQEIKIAISLREYFWLKKGRNPGFLYWTIDEFTRLEIINQVGWEKEFYICPMPNKNEGEERLFQCWELEEWLGNSKSKEISRKVSSVKAEFEQNELKKRHDEYREKELKAYNFLVKKGYSHAEAKRQVQHAKNPRVETTIDFDPDTLEEITVKKVNPLDLKLQQLFGLKFD